MKAPPLVKNLLIGLLPLLVFIIADEIYGTTIGLIVAMAFGLIELAVTFVRTKRLDGFIALDMGLLVLMGSVSLLLHDDIFFKLKPALIGLLLCIMLGISLFTPANLMLMMTKRYMAGVELSEAQQRLMRRNLTVLFYLLCGHTLLVVYAAYFMSKQAWAFISGVLLYILIGGYFLVEFVRNKLAMAKYKNQEWLPVVNAKGEVIGQAPRELCHQNKELLHPVVHLHVFNKKGQLYLQKRSLTKKIQPGKWDTSVGGHIPVGETVETGLAREALEELGISGFTPQFITAYLWESAIERELVYVFRTVWEGEITPNPQEIDEGRFWKKQDIVRQLQDGLLTANFVQEFPIIEPYMR